MIEAHIVKSFTGGKSTSCIMEHIVEAVMSNLPNQATFARDQNSPVIVCKLEHHPYKNVVAVYRVFVCLIQSQTRYCYSAEICQLNNGRLMTVDDIFVTDKKQVVQGFDNVSIVSIVNHNSRHEYPLEYASCILNCI